VRVAEQPSWRIAPELGGLIVIRVGAFAAGVESVPAEETFATCNRERNDDPITDLQRLVVRPDFHDLPHALMADDIAALHGRNDAAVNVQIRAADRTGADLDDCIARMLDARIGYLLTPDVAFTVPSQ